MKALTKEELAKLFARKVSDSFVPDNFTVLRSRKDYSDVEVRVDKKGRSSTYMHVYTWGNNLEHMCNNCYYSINLKTGTVYTHAGNRPDGFS